MKEILNKVVEETTEIIKCFNLTKIIFYWNMPYNNSTYTKCFNQNGEELIPLSDDLALGNINPKLFSNFYAFTQEMNKKQKINKGTLTIYPSGEYESLFIWDEEAHLGYLGGKVEGWLKRSFELSIYRIQDLDMFGIVGDYEVKIIISFSNGVSNPVLFILEHNPAMIYKMYLEQITFFPDFGGYSKETFEAYAKERDINSDLVAPDTNMYLMMNESELKGCYPRWNVASLIIKPSSRINFQDIKFEWVEENT